MSWQESLQPQWAQKDASRWRNAPMDCTTKPFYSLLMMHGRLLAKSPNPIAGMSHFTTASEVATLDFVCISCLREFNTSSILTFSFSVTKCAPDSGP